MRMNFSSYRKVFVKYDIYEQKIKVNPEANVRNVQYMNRNRTFHADKRQKSHRTVMRRS